MLKYLSLILLVTLCFAQELPQTFKQLSTPLYNSLEPLCKCADIPSVEVLLNGYKKELKEVKAFGYKADEDTRKTKEYLFKLRKLQKTYDEILYQIHLSINKSINENNYELFILLTEYKFDGLLKSTALYTKALHFYEKNKIKKKIEFFEEKIKYTKIEEATTQEFFNVATTDEYNSNTKQTNTSKKVKIQAQDKGKYIAIYIENLNPYTITIRVKNRLKNFTYDSYMKNQFTLKSGVKKEYMRLYKQDGRFTFSYSFSYTWIIGSVDAVHDDSYVYAFPYAKGTSHRVTQGYNGKYTHKGHSQYAIDFGMKIGTKVHAARDGVVVKIKEDSSKGGIGREFSQYGNYVSMEHSDSTLATYYHLNKDGVIPKLRDTVKRGEFIAYSGNTGYSSGPHLHLSIFKADSATRTKTIPIQLMSKKGIVKEVVQSVVYTAK